MLYWFPEENQPMNRNLACLLTSLTLLMTLSCEFHLSSRDTPHPTLVTGPLGNRFVQIPAGTFHRGSTHLDRFRNPDEMPAREITLTSDLYIGETEVTTGLFSEFLLATGYDMGEAGQILITCDDNLPAHNVSWRDAQAFIQWLNSRTREAVYRLPTETEWEYACRAGSRSMYFFGDRFGELDRFAWYWKNADRQPQPVATREPNPWGLYDVYGNVYEWTSDWYRSDSYRAGETVDPVGPETGRNRVLRGGGWSCNPDNCRSAYRNHAPPDKRAPAIGFRLVMEPVLR